MQDEHQYFEKEAGRPAGQNQADSCLYRRSTAGRKRGQAIVLSDSLEVSKEKAQAVYKRGQWPRFFFTKGGKGGIARKTYLSNVGGKLPTNLWLYADVGHTDEAKKEIMAVFESKAPFSTPKPTRLIERILQIASNDDSLILDFFAGSGTTGNAVLKYNAEHEGSARRFILCTNNENGICRDVTYERIRRVIDKEDYAASLKYYKVDYVPISDRMYYEYADELLRHIRELVELENGINFTGNEEIAIVLTEDELAAFIANKDRFAKCRRLYMGHDLLPDEEQEDHKNKLELQQKEFENSLLKQQKDGENAMATETIKGVLSLFGSAVTTAMDTPEAKQLLSDSIKQSFNKSKEG